MKDYCESKHHDNWDEETKENAVLSECEWCGKTYCSACEGTDYPARYEICDDCWAIAMNRSIIIRPEVDLVMFAQKIEDCRFKQTHQDGQYIAVGNTALRKSIMVRCTDKNIIASPAPFERDFPENTDDTV